MDKKKVVAAGIAAAGAIMQSPDKGDTAGRMVAGAVRLSHPVLGSIMGDTIHKGVRTVVNRVEAKLKDPEFQAQAVGVAKNVLGRSKGLLVSAIKTARNVE